MTTFNTPSGKFNCCINSVKKMADPATLSLGFKMKVFPVVKATGNIHKGIMAGKLKAGIPAQTPKGTLYEIQSTSLAMFYRVSPCIKLEKLAQCSTTSNPLKISPWASVKVLPCSSVSIFASSFLLSLISC